MFGTDLCHIPNFKSLRQSGKMNVGFLGISHLSLNHGAAFLEKGFRVMFFDHSSHLVEQIKEGTLDYSEPGLKEMLDKHKDRLIATMDPSHLKTCDILYIARDVPTDETGKSDLKETYYLFEIAKNQAQTTTSVVILCQVPPGFTRKLDFPKDRLFYQVETLVFGQALSRALHPERYIVGMSDPSTELSIPLKKLLESFECPLLKMRYESAELAKISINLFLISTVSTTNTIADLCEKIGADWFEIKGALQLDKRIGPHAYLNPGLGLSGGNLERDLTTTLSLAYNQGSPNTLVQAWVEDCTYRKDWVLKKLHQKVFSKYKNPSMGVLGLAYKVDTNSTKNSPSFHVLKNLQDRPIWAFDPIVKETPFSSVRLTTTVAELMDKEVVIIMTPWKEFKELPYRTSKSIKALIDPFNLLMDQATTMPFDYHCLGRIF